MGPSPKSGLSYLALTAVAVGSMVGAGIFTLPRSFGASTGPAGALVAWTITGIGMYALARVLQWLSTARPDLDAGIYAYAKEGFGNYAGFLAMLGYWLVACIGDVAYWCLLTAALGHFIPAFGEGDTIPALALATAGIWGFHFLILAGVKGAASVNAVVTVAKVIPIVLFIALLALSFDPVIFAENFWKGSAGEEAGILQQIRATMLITVFVFVGVEGANVYSRYARRRTDVGKATMTAFLLVLSLLLLVTLLPYGHFPRSEIAAMSQPSMASLLQAVVGHWGAILISLGLVISILGAYLAWTLLAIEVLFVAAQNRDMPRILSRESRRGVPVASLWFTTLTVQVLLFITCFADDAIRFLVELSASMALTPYFLVAAFAFRLVMRGQGGRDPRCFLLAGIALAYTVGMVYAGGLTILLLSLMFYAPGTILFVLIRREQKERIFSPGEVALCTLVVLGGLGGVIGLLQGTISI